LSLRLARLAGLAVLAAGAALWAGPVAPAEAHTVLVSSSPANGAVVARLPPTVSLTFAAPLAKVVRAQVLDVRGRERAVSARLSPRFAGTVLIRTRRGPRGRYTVRVGVLARDGHVVTGTIRFRARR
jgi:methionine-rich copper-binding protein CopC